MIYYDNASTSFPKPEAVYQAIENTLRKGGNAGRGSSVIAADGTRLLQETRAHLAAFFGVTDPSRIVYAFNATDALNMAFKGVLNPGDHVVTTEIEHNSVLRPLNGMAATGYISLTIVPAKTEGLVEPADIRDAIRPETCLVAVAHASNVLGTVQPVAAIAEICRERSIPLLVDAAQSAGEYALDVEKTGIDMLAFPGHKGLLGPQGTGGLYVREGITIRPWREGGTGTQSELLLQPGQFPARLEAGTQNLPGIAGLAAGLAFLRKKTVEDVRSHYLKQVNRIVDALGGDDRFRIFGPVDPGRRVNVLSLIIKRMDPVETGMILDQRYGISIRAGLHCASLIHKRIGTLPTGTVRLSPGIFTTDEETEQVIAALKEIAAS